MRLSVPNLCPIREAQLGTPAQRLPLLAAEPFAQPGDDEVVRELVIAQARVAFSGACLKKPGFSKKPGFCRAGFFRPAGRGRLVRLGRRNQPQLAI